MGFWETTKSQTEPVVLARFSVLTRRALAFIMLHLFQPLNGRSLFVMLLLIADVVYHPFQILRAETNDTIACLPIQAFAIYEFVINLVRTPAFQLPNPIADKKRRRDRNRDMNMSLSAADFMKDEAF